MSGTTGLYAQQYVDNTFSIAASGFGTSTNHISYSLRRDAAATNLLTESAAGVAATLNTASSTSINVTGAGTTAAPLTAAARISSTNPYNRIFIDTTAGTGGLTVPPEIVDTTVTSRIRPGATDTVVPRFNPRFSGEVMYLYGQNTTFTVDFTSAPTTITDKQQYTVRLIGTYDGSYNTSFLKFATASANIRDSQGNYVSCANYVYPFGQTGSIFVIDICYNYGIGWCIQEQISSIEDTQTFRSTLALGSGAGTLTLDNSALPYHLRSSYWTIRPSLYAMPTATHTRTVTLGTTQLYNATVSFVAGIPFMLPACYFTVATTTGTPSTLAALPNLVATWGTGTGNVTVKGMLVCHRTITASGSLDTL
jgi:hypothetical protein